LSWSGTEAAIGKRSAVACRLEDAMALSADVGKMLSGFGGLTPDSMIEAVEREVGKTFSGLASPLPSYINRVYEFMAMDGERYIAKFYRPGRWSRAAVEEEHVFVLDCAREEIPVVPPIELPRGGTLAEADGVFFALYPKRSGREIELSGDEAWRRLGALVARMHNVGAECDAPNRLTLSPENTAGRDVDLLLGGGFVPKRLAERFRDVAGAILEAAAGLFDGIEKLRIHGDCHRANILERPGEGLMVIDFDDMMTGPPVQDLWLLLPGRVDKCRREVDLLLDGYWSMRDFDDSTLRLVEPLRAMRMIYFLAWCARQSEDYSFREHFPDWGSDSFWMAEIADLECQASAIREADASWVGGGQARDVYVGRVLTDH